MSIAKFKAEEFQNLYPRLYPEFETEEGEIQLATRSVTFAITEQCNLRCSYCYQHNKNDTAMTKEMGEKIVDMLFKLEAEGNEYLNEKTQGH